MIRRSVWIWIALLVWMGFMVGCAKPPTEEIEAAQAAVERARTAEADKYVPAEFSALEDSLNAALTAVEQKKYDRARASAVNVVDMAERVVTRAIQEKARIKKETEDLIAQAQAAIDSVRSVLGVAPVAKGTKADIEQFRADLSALQASLSQARAAISREQFSEAKATAQTIQARANSLKAEIQAAIEKYKKWRRRR